MGEEIYRDNNKIIDGINKLADTVKVTMGPEGKTVVIFNHELNKYILTKDGVSVSDSVFLKDPVENIGAQLVKEVAQKTVKEAGDGTTTSIVVTQALLQDGLTYLENGHTITELRKNLDDILKDLLIWIQTKSKQIDKDSIRDIAFISANNDNEIADIIHRAFQYSNNVQVEKGNDEDTYIETRDGIEYPVTYIDKKFITDNKKNIAKLDNARVLLIDGKLNEIDKIGHILRSANAKQEPLIIFADDFSEKVIKILITNQINEALQIIPIRTPGMGKYRSEYLHDLSMITNGDVYNLLSSVKYENLGLIKNITCDPLKTLIIPNDDANIDGLHRLLYDKLNDKTLEEYEKERLLRRIDNIGGKCSIIRVGAKSVLEQKEKFDRVDDAVLACKSALEEGIVAGGGIELKEFRDQSKHTPLLLNWLLTPYNTIKNNGFSGNYINVYDPAKVVRCAVENAFSVVKQILSVKAVVLNPFSHGQF